MLAFVVLGRWVGLFVDLLTYFIVLYGIVIGFDLLVLWLVVVVVLVWLVWTVLLLLVLVVI